MRILLLLDQKENQQLLARELSERNEVVIAESDERLDDPFDLCVLDGLSLDRLRVRVEARKAREQPIFLPVLLVTSKPGVKMITRQVWRSVDELIITPIERPELRARVEVLRRARELSLALQQRAEDAERATRTRDEVLAVVSHDLRNSLNLVLMNAGFLLSTSKLEESAEKHVEMVHRAAGQMNRLIQDLLDVSGLEAGQLSMQARPEAVAPIVQEACAMHESAAIAKSVNLGCEVEPGLPDVCADRERILQVFGNLIGNALKFTPAGGTISVRAKKGAQHVSFSVSDTGSGIDAVHLPHVFDRFWQARRSGDGAGLGLAISRGIIVAHGGEIDVESNAGAGSTFRFTLPFANAD